MYSYLCPVVICVRKLTSQHRHTHNYYFFCFRSFEIAQLQNNVCVCVCVEKVCLKMMGGVAFSQEGRLVAKESD